MKIETDETAIRSGVRHGITFGSPITLAIENRDWVNWQEKMAIGAIDKVIEPITRLRPGHADLPLTTIKEVRVDAVFAKYGRRNASKALKSLCFSRYAE